MLSATHNVPESPMSKLCRIIFPLLFGAATAQAQIAVTGLNTPVNQDFNTLAASGTANPASGLPAGWVMLEVDDNANTTYRAGDGASSTGDTYSFGTGTNAERAFGSLDTGSLQATIGASFVNNTGTTVTHLYLRYFGEMWRLGDPTRSDRLDFQYSLNATGLGNGSWVDVNALDVTTVSTAGVAGARNGNLDANRQLRFALISGLSIAPGQTFFLRWAPFDAFGSDDGLAIDDFELRAFDQVPAVVAVRPLAFIEGDTGSSTANVLVTLATPVSANVVFDAAAAGISADAGDFTPFAGVPGVIAAGSTSTNVAVNVLGDVTVEPAETLSLTIANVSTAVPLVVANASATVLLINDDPRSLISQIQGNGNTSPLNNTLVAFEGIVTGVGARSFFVQEEDAHADSDPMTSEGVFVFSNAPPATDVVAGARARVVGTVTEFARSPNSEKLTVTEIVSPIATVVSSGNPLPAPAALPTPSSANAIDAYERYEGMLVTLAGDYTVTGPTDGSMNDSTGLPTQFGSIFVTPLAAPRPFREPGSDLLDLLSDLPTPCARPCYDSNEEVISVDTDDLLTPALEIDVGQGISNVRGPLHFDFGSYLIAQDPFTALAVTGSAKTPVAAPPANSRQITIGSYNLQRLYDDVDDATDPDQEPMISAAGLELRFSKMSAQMRDYLRLPDILAVVEVENLAVLVRLAERINLDAGADNPQYGACLVDGPGFGALDVGFLVKQRPVYSGGPPRVQVALGACNQILGNATHVDPRDGSVDLTYDRPPLRLNATIHDANGQSFAVSVIANHFLSLLSVSDNTPDGASTDGERGRVKRRDQAEELAAYIHTAQAGNPSTRFVVLGDFNAFQFNDSYGDIIGGLAGTPAPAADQLTPVGDFLSGNLSVLTLEVPAADRYSYVESGVAQTLDHVLINPAMASDTLARSVHHARINAEFANGRRALAGDPRRASDHDPVIAYFDIAAFNAAPATVGTLSAQAGIETMPLSIATAAGFSDADGDLLSYSVNALPSALAINPATGEISGTPGVGSASGSPYTVEVTATDPFGVSAMQSFQLTITPLSDGIFLDSFE